MKKILCFSLALFSLILFSFAFFGCRETGMNPTTSPGSSLSPSTQTPPLSEVQALPVAILETEKGTIKFEMYPDEAFNTVSNFIYLAKKGFYDGLTFHRVEPGFVIQGGDPNGNGTGGPGYHIKAEFNSRKHLEGTVAMARADDPDSAGSQFYICLSPQPHLDGKYTVFGQVIEGMDVVKRIQVGDKIIKVRLENAEGYPEPEKLP